MSSLVHAALTLRRTARATFGFVAAGALVTLDLLGVFRGLLGVEHALVGALFAGIGLARAHARWKLEDDARDTAVRDATALDLELCLLLIGGVHAIVQAF